MRFLFSSFSRRNSRFFPAVTRDLCGGIPPIDWWEVQVASHKIKKCNKNTYQTCDFEIIKLYSHFSCIKRCQISCYLQKISKIWQAIGKCKNSQVFKLSHKLKSIELLIWYVSSCKSECTGSTSSYQYCGISKTKSKHGTGNF